MKKELFNVMICIFSAIAGSTIGILLFFISGYHYELLGIEIKTLLIGGGLMGALIAASVISPLWFLKEKHFTMRIGATTIGGSIAGGIGGWIGYYLVDHLWWISQWGIIGSGLYFGAGIALCIISWIELSKRLNRLIKDTDKSCRRWVR